MMVIQQQHLHPPFLFQENASLELSLQEGRWEARLRSREAELSGEHEARLRAKTERLEQDAAEAEVAMRDGHRRQVAEMSERHREELRVQKDAHQRETTQREQRWVEAQQQYQTRLGYGSYHNLRAIKVLILFKDVLLKTRRVLSLYRVCGDNTLLVLNGTLLNVINALLALSQRYIVNSLKTIYLFIFFAIKCNSKKPQPEYTRE